MEAKQIRRFAMEQFALCTSGFSLLQTTLQVIMLPRADNIISQAGSGIILLLNINKIRLFAMERIHIRLFAVELC